MPTTYILGSGNSDLSGGADFNKALVADTQTPTTISVQMAPGGGNEDSFAYTAAGVPGIAGVTGDYTVEVNVITAANNSTLQVAVARVNSAGVQQAISAFDTAQSLSTGVKTFTLTGVNLGTWAAGDRLRVVYRFRNTHNSQTRTAEIQTGTTDTEVVAPWAGAANVNATGLSTDIFVGSVNPSETAPSRTRGMGSGLTVEPPIVSQLRVSWFVFEVPEAAPSANPPSISRTRALGSPTAQWAAQVTTSAISRTRALGDATVASGAPKQTGTARLSIATSAYPESRTNHAIALRARKTNAAHSGVLRARLYEGATPITDELETPELTTSLGTYPLLLTDQEAASIGSYEDLELRIYGYAIDGDATVFELAEAWLQTPASLPVVEPGSLARVPALGSAGITVDLAPTGLVRTRSLGGPTASSDFSVSPASLERTGEQGAPTVNPSTAPAGLERVRALGDPTATSAVVLQTTSLDHAGELGSPAINSTVPVTGIDHGRTQGNATVSPGVSPQGLARTRELGSPSATSAVTLQPSALERSRAQGTPTLNPSVSTTGLNHDRALGELAVGTVLVPSSLIRTRATGTPTLSPTVPVGSIVHTREVGNPFVSPGVTTASIVGTRALGDPSLSSVTGIQLGGLEHARALGTPTLGSTVPVASIVRTRTLGSTTLAVQLAPTGLAHTRTIGSPALSSVFVISPAPLVNARLLGGPTTNSSTLPVSLVHARSLGSPSTTTGRWIQQLGERWDQQAQVDRWVQQP